MLNTTEIQRLDWELEALKRRASIKIGPKPTAEFKQRYQDVYPEYMFYYWDKIGFAEFANGGMWLVNPADYEETLELILKDTPFFEHDDFFVVTRTAFGTLEVIGKHTKSDLTIYLANQTIFPTIKHARHLTNFDLIVSAAVSIASGIRQTMYDKEGIYNFDMPDTKGRFLFDRCLTNLGPLQADEIYGFQPALVLGGKKDIRNIAKVNFFSHASFLAQLQPFEVMMDIVATVDQMGLTPENAHQFRPDTDKPPFYDLQYTVQEGTPALVDGYYQDGFTQKLIYLKAGDISPVYPRNQHGSKTRVYIWYKVSHYGLREIPQETLDKVKP